MANASGTFTALRRGYRERHWYHDKKAAKQAAEDRNAELAAFGSNLSLADAHRLEAAECIKRLLPFNKSLTDATNFYLKHLNNQKTSITNVLDDCVDLVCKPCAQRPVIFSSLSG